MGSTVLKPFVLLILGSSLSSNGRLSFDWTQKLQKELQQYPEAKGPIQIVNGAKGSQDSAGLLSLIAPYAALRPSHVLMETNSINDAVDSGSGPAVTIANHDANTTASVAALRAARAGVDITIQTMSPVSTAGAALRPNLAAYYARDVALAASLVTSLNDNYNGTATVPGGWAKPLDPLLTNGAAPWLIAATATYSGLGAQWNPADKAAAISLDTTGMIITGAGRGAVRANLTATAKLHYEFTFTSGAANLSFGLAIAAMDLGGLVGQTSDSIGIFPQGASPALVYRYAGGVTTNLGSAGFVVSDGDTVAMEYDPTAKLVYYMKGGVRTAGLDVSAIGAALYPAASSNSNVSASTKFTNEGDGLHPIFTGALDTYLYPNVVAAMRAKMAAYWP